MFNFDHFCNIMQHLAFVREQQERVYAILRDPVYDSITNDFVSPYAWSNPYLEDDLIDSLEEMYEDESHWISYYIYDLNFGTEWYPGCITDTDGNDIELKCLVDLWNLLMTKMVDGEL